MLCGCHNRPCNAAKIVLLLATIPGHDCYALAISADTPDISKIQEAAAKASRGPDPLRLKSSTHRL